jgi:hypothetical protein
VTSLFSNPELRRIARSQLRTRKMLAVAAICALLSISVGYLFAQRESPPNEAHRWAMDLLELVLAAQALVLGAGGGIACLNSVFKEKEQNSFDFQRLTRLSPLELALGKLFGAPILMYFVCLCLMPLSIFAAMFAHSEFFFFLAAYVVLLVASITFHALGLLMSVLSIRGSQTGAIILILLLIWISSYGGGISSSTVFRLGSLGPFFAPQLVSQTTWNPRELEKHFNYNGVSYEYNGGMTDVLFGKHVHHFPVLLVLDVLLALWFFIAIVRNIKRDPAEYELYSPAQSLGLALFLNVVFLAFFNWRQDGDVDGAAFLLSLNMGVFIVLGLALLRNRERMRRIVRMRVSAPRWLDKCWPSPLLFAATLGAGAFVALGAVLSRAPGQASNLSFLIFRVLFFALWIVRDQQYLQWMSLRNGRNPLVMGVLYLVIFYVCSGTVLTAFDSFVRERIAFTAFFMPTPVYWLDPVSWMERPAIWIAAYLAQLALIAFFVHLQRQQLVELTAHSDSPTLAKQLAS